MAKLKACDCPVSNYTSFFEGMVEAFMDLENIHGYFEAIS